MDILDIFRVFLSNLCCLGPLRLVLFSDFGIVSPLIRFPSSAFPVIVHACRNCIGLLIIGVKILFTISAIVIGLQPAPTLGHLVPRGGGGVIKVAGQALARF